MPRLALRGHQNERAKGLRVSDISLCSTSVRLGSEGPVQGRDIPRAPVPSGATMSDEEAVAPLDGNHYEGIIEPLGVLE
eukprot:5722913-Pyramimonas_sp.AAC.1